MGLRNLKLRKSKINIKNSRIQERKKLRISPKKMRKLVEKNVRIQPKNKLAFY